MPYRIDEYEQLLASAADEIGEYGCASKVGSGASAFVHAKAGTRALELSWDNEGIWVEFFVGDDDEATTERTFPTMQLALDSAREWLGNGTQST